MAARKVLVVQGDVVVFVLVLGKVNITVSTHAYTTALVETISTYARPVSTSDCHLQSLWMQGCMQ